MTRYYVDHLIKQYHDKPKARAEIEAMTSNYQKIKKLADDFFIEFDVDFARGKQLDTIGKIVGIDREVPEVVAKALFGFEDDPDAKGFMDLFAIEGEEVGFSDIFGTDYTSLQLNDDQYRHLIKVKIGSNIARATMISFDDKPSINDAVLQAFNGKAFVTDNKDMTLTLSLSPSLSLQEIRLFFNLGLIPRPIGVDYKYVVNDEIGATFGFDDDLNAVGFGDVFASAEENRGYFASLIQFNF